MNLQELNVRENVRKCLINYCNKNKIQQKVIKSGEFELLSDFADFIVDSQSEGTKTT